MPYFLHDEFRICQRAAWSLGMASETHPELIVKWLPQIISAMKAPKHDAIIRNAIRTFQNLKSIPEQYEGEIYELCFEYLTDPKYPIAFKAFSMTVCRRIVMEYPELKGELIEVIQDAMEKGSAGIMSRGKRELKMLRR